MRAPCSAKNASLFFKHAVVYNALFHVHRLFVFIFKHV